MLKRKKLIIWIVIILAIIVGGYFFLQSKKPKTEYITATVSRGDLMQTVSVTGKVNPDSQVDIAFETPGKLVAVYVENGDVIGAGDKLAMIDNSALLLRLSQAEDDYAYQKKTLSHIKDEDDTYSKNQRKAQEAVVSKAEAAIEAAKLNLENAVIYSPISGLVIGSDYRIGEVVMTGVAVVTVSSSKELIIESKIPESDIIKIENGQRAIISLDAFRQEDEFEAQIYDIDPAATIIQDVVYYKIKLKLDSVNAKFKIGMSADIDIKTAEVKDALMLPLRAIETDDDGQKFVQVLEAGEKIEKIKITTGLEGDEGMAEIKSGLEGGEEVITYIKNGK